MGRLRAWIEAALPWYEPTVEAKRDERTERIVQRSEEARGRAGGVIAEYRRAEAAASHAGERLIEEVERSSDAQ